MIFDVLWHLRGSVRLNSQTSNEVTLDRLEELLIDQDKSNIDRTSSALAFDDPLWDIRVSNNWLALALYDHGSFWIEQGLGGRKLRYDLRSLHALIFCLCAGLMFFAFAAIGAGMIGGMKVGATMFGLLYGANLLLALLRVPLKVRKVVVGA